MWSTSLRRNTFTGPELPSPRSTHWTRNSSTGSRYAPTTETAMQHQNRPQEPRTKLRPPNEPMTIIQMGVPEEKPRSATNFEPTGLQHPVPKGGFSTWCITGGPHYYSCHRLFGPPKPEPRTPAGKGLACTMLIDTA